MVEQSFMRSLFFGAIEEGLVFPWPSPTSGEVDALHGVIDGTRRFLDEKVDSSAIDRQGRIPDEVIHGLRKLGAFGWLVPQSYGGTGLSHTGYARVIEEVASRDSSLAVTLGAHQSLGLSGIVGFGSDAVRSRLLPRLATGELVAAFALTERGAGSDAAAIQMRAERDGEGHYVLRGSKVWVTNGGFANVFTVFARTSPAEEGAKPRLTAFVIERGPGIESGPEEGKLGIRGTSTAEVRFDGVRVPVDNVLGEAGRGHRVAMDVLNGGRLGLASGCLGICKRVIQMAIARCQERRAFGRPIGEFGLIKDKIASMLADTWALESVVYLTTGMIDAGARDFAIESAICKVYGSETCWRVVNEAMQIAAGMGYMEGSGYERILRDARVNLVFEGTNEILRAFIALSGMQGPGRALADVGRAMREPIKGFGLLSDFAMRRARSAFGRARVSRHHPLLQREAAVLEQYTHDLARGVDKVLRTHGRDIAEMQYTQKRAADIAIDLYAIAACLSRTTRTIERRGEEGARRAIDFTNIFVATAERRLAQTVAAIDRNDDELRKSVASRTYADGGYPFDVL
jgi:acyl-CoA dehydrogenase family protein 9